MTSKGGTAPRSIAGRRRSLSDGDKPVITAKSTSKKSEAHGPSKFGNRCVEGLLDLVHHFEGNGDRSSSSGRAGQTLKKTDPAEVEKISTKKSSKIILPLLAALSPAEPRLKMEERSDRSETPTEDDEDITIVVDNPVTPPPPTKPPVKVPVNLKVAEPTQKPTTKTKSPRLKRRDVSPSPAAASNSSSPQNIKAHVASTGPKRILVLAAKGDWGAVDLALRGLEKAASGLPPQHGRKPAPDKEAILHPLADVSEEVSVRFRSSKAKLSPL